MIAYNSYFYVFICLVMKKRRRLKEKRSVQRRKQLVVKSSLNLNFL
jgi:hypothetical protein